MRAASRSMSSVVPTGVVGPAGQVGWQATLAHNIDDTSDMPLVMQDGVKVWTYNPTTQQISVDGTVVAGQIADSYLQITNGDIVLGVRVENETGGSQAMMESLIRMRNP
jgi:hypothetical protein